MEHLTKEARKIVDLSFAEKREYMKRIWIGYDGAAEIISQLNELRNHPDHHRMPCMLIVGTPNNGKSTIIDHFQARNRSYVDHESNQLVAPVITIQMPHEPNEVEFYDAILDVLNTPYSQSARKTLKKKLVVKGLESLHVKVFVIDEFHNMLAGSPMKQRILIQLVKWLANELRLSIVAAGTKAAYVALQTDPQLASRFTPYVLAKWKLEDEAFFTLLASFEALLPLKKPSNLMEDEIAHQIFYMTDRTIGQLSDLLKLAATEAIKSGEERITMKVLKKIKWKTAKTISKELEQEI